MRIIAGKIKGKKILLPPDKFTRPLRDLVKESIFNLITHSNKINFDIINSNVLDLFSGTGSFGLECLSRGANKVTFFENYPPVINILEKNIANTKFYNKSILFKYDCFSFFKRNENNYSYDLIFVDPPFKEKKTNKLLEIIRNKKIMKETGIIIIHRHKNDDDIMDAQFNIIEQRKYGISKITIGNLG